MKREQALAILGLPRKRAEAAIVALWEKAERWERIEASSKGTSVAPTTPSGMTPVYLKPSPSRRCKKPGRKPHQRPMVRRAGLRHDALPSA